MTFSLLNPTFCQRAVSDLNLEYYDNLYLDLCEITGSEETVNKAAMPILGNHENMIQDAFFNIVLWRTKRSLVLYTEGI